MSIRVMVVIGMELVVVVVVERVIKVDFGILVIFLDVRRRILSIKSWLVRFKFMFVVCVKKMRVRDK